MEVIDGSNSNAIDATDSRPASTSFERDVAELTPSTDRILYAVEECPPWYLCAFLAFQVSIIVYSDAL